MSKRTNDLFTVVDLPFKLQINPVDTLPESKVQDPESIFSYDNSLEKSIILRHSQNADRDSSSDNKRDINSSLPLSPLPSSTFTPNPPQNQSQSAHSQTPNESPKEQAQRISKLYLPDDTASRQSAFTQLYIDAKPLGCTDMQILRSFFLHEENLEAAREYLKSFLVLIEFGFEEEDISEALLMHKNDQEKALDHLVNTAASK